MKEFLLIFTTIIVLTSAVPDRCGSGVKHSYPGDNTKFIICENNIPLAKKCPSGTTFNSNVQVCDSAGNSASGSNLRNVDVISGTQIEHNTNTQPYGNPNYSSQSVNQNQYQGNSLDQSTGTAHSSGTEYTSSYSSGSVTKSGQSSNQGYDQGQYNGQSLTGRTQSGYSGSTGHTTNVEYGQGSNSNQNLHYAGTSQSGYRGITAGHSIGTVPISGQGYSNQGYDSGYDNRYKSGTKNYQHSDSGVGGSYNDHKTINSNNDLWLQNQNHGLDQNHINLNEIRGSTGHAANSCNKVPAGDHIPYSGDCTKFIVCMENGNNVVKDCPPKTHFNPQLQICDWPESAGCTC